MSRRDLSALDRDIGQDWSRIIMEYFRDGSTGAVISEGGLITSRTAQGVLSVSATQNYLLGTKLEKDRKIYRYAQTDTGTALVAGTLLESPAFGGGADVAEEDCAVETASTAGSTYGYASIISTGGAAANAFQYGHYIVNDGGSTVGEGQCMEIASHPATTSSGSVKFTFGEALPVGITTGASVTLLANEFNDVIITTTGTAVGMAVGVSRVAVPVATPYFWCQRKGITACLCSTGTAQTIGKKIHRDLSYPGAVVIDNITTGTLVITEVVGCAAMAGDVGDSVVLNLTLE